MPQQVSDSRVAQEGDVYLFRYAADTDSSTLGSDARDVIEHQVESFRDERFVQVVEIENERRGVDVRFAVLEPAELRKIVPSWLTYPVPSGGNAQGMAQAQVFQREYVSTLWGGMHEFTELEAWAENLWGGFADAARDPGKVTRKVGETIDEATGGFLSGLFSGAGGAVVAVVGAVALGVVLWIATENLTE